jgi:sulfur transfer complex TusBCD TusB component (DsrH family)
MSYIAILKLIVQLLPLIIDTVKAIEAAIPAAGKGSAKLEAVKGIVMEVAAIAGDVDSKNLSAALDKAISLVVTLLNKTGVFSKGA